MRISDWSSDVCSSDLASSAACSAASISSGVLSCTGGTVERALRRSISAFSASISPSVSCPFMRSAIHSAAAAFSLLAFMPSDLRSGEHTSELQSLLRISYAVFCLHTQNTQQPLTSYRHHQHFNLT